MRLISTDEAFLCTLHAETSGELSIPPGELHSRPISTTGLWGLRQFYYCQSYHHCAFTRESGEWYRV